MIFKDKLILVKRSFKITQFVGVEITIAAQYPNFAKSLGTVEELRRRSVKFLAKAVPVKVKSKPEMAAGRNKS